MATNQELRQTSARALSGSSLDYNGDMSAMFTAAGITAGDFNGRFLAWLNGQLSASYTSLPTAMNAYAALLGLTNWDAVTSFYPSGATLDMNFVTAVYTGAATTDLTVTRSGLLASDLTYDQTSRTSYNSFGSNTLRVDGSASRGLLVEEGRTQYLGVTDAPATQTTGSLGTGTYTCWCNGGTSVAIAGTTATITGAGSAVPGTPLTFVVTVAGTVTATVTGAVRFFQIENGSFPTSYIPNGNPAGTTATRSNETIVLSGAPLAVIYTGGASGTVYAEGSSFDTGGANINCLVSLDDTTSANRIQSRRTAANASSFVTVTASSLVEGSGTNGVFPINTVVKMAHAYAAGDQRGATNGTLNAGGTGASPGASVTEMVFGSGPAVQLINGFLRRVVYWPSRLSNGVLQQIST